MIDTICLNMLSGLLLICSPGGERTGYASWYQSDILMDATVALRQEYGQLPQDLSRWDGHLATMSCDLIGHTVMVRRLPIGKGKMRDKEPDQWRNYLVTDCSGHASTTHWMAENGIKVEFGARTARKLGIHGRYGIPIEVVVVATGQDRLVRAFGRLISFRDHWPGRETALSNQ